MSPRDVRRAALEQVQKRSEVVTGSDRMKGKVGVITGVGPSTGIGTATARLMAREGAQHLYLLDFDDTHLKPLCDTLGRESSSTKVTSIKADAASHSAISSLVDRVLQEEGHLDFFFANVGILQVRPDCKAQNGDLEKMTGEPQRISRRVGQIGEEEFSEIMRINALSVFLAIKYASTAMRHLCPEKGKVVPGGSIVLTASVAGLKANAGPIPYSASKAAVISMAQTAAYELTGQNIRVNAICPGLIQTDMTKPLFELAKSGGKEDKIGVLNPLLRQGIGSEVAHLALFLASDDASYVNGQALAVDGGLTAGVPFVRAKM